MKIETLSVFPQLFLGASSPVDSSIIGRARNAALLEMINHDLRDYTHDRHRTTDDEPYGGGPGLVMKVEPVFEALDRLVGPWSSDIAQARTNNVAKTDMRAYPHVVFFAPFGERFDQAMAEELADYQHLVMVCGHYEGFDERVYERADRIISLGDFILTGAELAAMCVIDAVCRLLPGVLGDEQSALDESFNGALLEYPQFTRPANYRGLEVPEVLLSGNHAQIRQWRREQSIIRTARLRPDLLEKADLSAAEREWVKQHVERHAERHAERHDKLDAK
jgi:tRNA (guanine37-N1)-methyltransferase